MGRFAGSVVEVGADRAVQEAAGGAEKLVRHFRQILIWPVHVMPPRWGAQAPDYAAAIAAAPGSPWAPVDDEFGDPGEFQERHYNEFVTFLPSVQRFLYGQGLGKSVQRAYGESPIKVLRRSDIAAMRVVFSEGEAAVTFSIAHVDLYFFYDIDVASLALEIHAEDLPLPVAQEAMFQLGRAYPAYWQPSGEAGHCPFKVEWLSAGGEVLAASDYQNRRKFLDFVCEHRAPTVSAHWDHLLRPLTLHHADRSGAFRYRQLEYYRMPLMAFLAMEDTECLTAADRRRLALASGPPGDGATGSDATRIVGQGDHGPGARPMEEPETGGTRHYVSQHAFVVVGDASNGFFTDAERGYLARFRHQHFLLFLIAHFHRAALLMFSDRLAAAVSRLDVNDQALIREFRAETRSALETFLRFTHRYWFSDVSDQVQARALFDQCRRQLRLDPLYADIRQELQDMSQYLDGDAQRRQNASMVRLTVVTTFGLIGTVTTGFLGMNLLDWAEQPLVLKALAFAVILVPSTVLTFYTVRKSARLSEFLDALSDERLGFGHTLAALRRVWKTK